MQSAINEQKTLEKHISILKEWGEKTSRSIHSHSFTRLLFTEPKYNSLFPVQIWASFSFSYQNKPALRFNLFLLQTQQLSFVIETPSLFTLKHAVRDPKFTAECGLLYDSFQTYSKDLIVNHLPHLRLQYLFDPNSVIQEVDHTRGYFYQKILKTR